jgi:hypothetical protein
MESNLLEGDMEPSWTFPIPQAMQRHLGSQVRKLAPAPADEVPLVPADSVTPAVMPPTGEPARARHELVWG